jgi:hypothetical protein
MRYYRGRVAVVHYDLRENFYVSFSIAPGLRVTGASFVMLWATYPRNMCTFRIAGITRLLAHPANIDTMNTLHNQINTYQRR